MLNIGIDDTDSRDGMCTTYLAFKIIQYLISDNAEFKDYPLLIRLNPNIPWKTRGNGAICIRVEADEERVFRHISMLMDRYAYVGKNSNPALVIYSSNLIDDELVEFGKQALYTLIPRSKAYQLARRLGVKVYSKGNGQGIVGALAAIGSMLDDHTYELIAYRYMHNCRKSRIISADDVIKMDRETYPHTFNNYDYHHNRVLITPHGPDPVFLGIRGEDPNVLLKAFRMLNIKEELEGYVIFKTNQGTNAHLRVRLDSLKPYHSGYIEGIVDDKPYTIKGGHTFFSINNIPCAVYEPTGLSAIAQRLRKGDKVRVGGGVRKASRKHPRVLNVEYIHVLELAEDRLLLNPLCICGKRLKSAGKDKGYKCEYCNYKGFRDKEVVTIKRSDIEERLYIPLPKAHRHLTKPLHRYGLEKDIGYELIDDWYNFAQVIVK